MFVDVDDVGVMKSCDGARDLLKTRKRLSAKFWQEKLNGEGAIKIYARPSIDGPQVAPAQQSLEQVFVADQPGAGACGQQSRMISDTRSVRIFITSLADGANLHMEYVKSSFMVCLLGAA